SSRSSAGRSRYAIPGSCSVSLSCGEGIGKTAGFTFGRVNLLFRHAAFRHEFRKGAEAGFALAHWNAEGVGDLRPIAAEIGESLLAKRRLFAGRHALLSDSFGLLLGRVVVENPHLPVELGDDLRDRWRPLGILR